MKKVELRPGFYIEVDARFTRAVDQTKRTLLEKYRNQIGQAPRPRFGKPLKPHIPLVECRKIATTSIQKDIPLGEAAALFGYTKTNRQMKEEMDYWRRTGHEIKLRRQGWVKGRPNLKAAEAIRTRRAALRDKQAAMPQRQETNASTDSNPTPTAGPASAS